MCLVLGIGGMRKRREDGIGIPCVDVMSSKSGWEYRLHCEVLNETLRYFSTNQLKVFNFIHEVNDTKINLQK